MKKATPDIFIKNRYHFKTAAQVKKWFKEKGYKIERDLTKSGIIIASNKNFRRVAANNGTKDKKWIIGSAKRV